jgi:hypothetical protein
MLVYLDALIDALTTRDVAEAERLLSHPLARLLPEEVRSEAGVITAGTRDSLAAPLRAMQLRYQTAQLLTDAHAADRPALPEAVEAPLSAPQPQPQPPPPPPPTLARRPTRPQQMELPLSA